jgi:hypothetical protein
MSHHQTEDKMVMRKQLVNTRKYGKVQTGVAENDGGKWKFCLRKKEEIIFGERLLPCYCELCFCLLSKCVNINIWCGDLWRFMCDRNRSLGLMMMMMMMIHVLFCVCLFMVSHIKGRTHMRVWEQGPEVDLKERNWHETGENYIVRNFLVFALYQILLVW